MELYHIFVNCQVFFEGHSFYDKIKVIKELDLLISLSSTRGLCILAIIKQKDCPFGNDTYGRGPERARE